MAWNSFKNIADRSLQQKGITTHMQESLIIETANQLLLDIFGEEMKDKVRAVYWSSQILTMAVLSDDVLGQLQAKQVVFIKQLNSKFNSKVVESIKFLN